MFSVSRYDNGIGFRTLGNGGHHIKLSFVVARINKFSFFPSLLLIQVLPDIAVAALKILVQDATHVPEDRQRLIYRGKVLKNGDPLSTYKVEDGHTVHMVARPLPSPVLAPRQGDASALASADNTTTSSLTTAASDPGDLGSILRGPPQGGLGGQYLLTSPNLQPPKISFNTLQPCEECASTHSFFLATLKTSTRSILIVV